MSYSPFGSAVFGKDLFGNPPPTVITPTSPSNPIITNPLAANPVTAFASTTLTVTPFGYTALQVTWIPISSSQMTQQILVRSAFGTPTSIYDGTILLNQTSNFSLQYFDNNLQSGHFYYYALFILTPASATPQVTAQYIQAGAAQGLVLTDYNFGDTFQSWMPDWYLEADSSFATTAQPDGPLVRYLELLGFEMDWIRSEIESLFLLTNVQQISGALLPELGANYGVTYEPELGMTRSRVLVKNAVFLYKNRGTIEGIEAAGSAFSGYGCGLQVGANLLIQLDDAAFDLSVGHWFPTNASTTIAVMAASTYNVVPPHTTWNPMPTDPIPGIQGYLPENNLNVALISSNGAIVSLNTTKTETSVNLGIPVVQNEVYVASAYFLPVAPVVLQSFFVQIHWYAANGGFISASAGTPVTEISGTWVRASVTATPPAGAAYCGLGIRSSGALGSDLHLLDAVQLEQNSLSTPGPSVWQPPRDLQLVLSPSRQNLFTNPTGKGGTTSWTAGSATLTASTAAIAWPAGTTQGFLLNPSGTNGCSMHSSTIPVVGGESYTLSWYQQAATNHAATFGATIQWQTATGSNIGSAIASTILSEPFGSWQQASLVNKVAPANAALAIINFVVFTPTVNGQGHYIGAPLFAPESAVLPYFDATFLPVTDYLFEGTTNASISDYYPALPARIARLATVLPDYTPIGSTFSLFALAFVPGTPPATQRPTTNFNDWDDSLDTWDNATDTWD